MAHMTKQKEQKQSWTYPFPEPETEKISSYEAQAKTSNADAQFNLGVCYEMGMGVKQDYKKAKNLYEKSAGGKNILALYRLGCFYGEGIGGISKDMTKSALYFQKAEALLIINFGKDDLKKEQLSKNGVITNNYALQGFTESGDRLLSGAIKDENVDLIKQILPIKLKCIEFHIKSLMNDYFRSVLSDLIGTNKKFSDDPKKQMNRIYFELTKLKTSLPETVQSIVEPTIEEWLNDKQRYSFWEQKNYVNQKISTFDEMQDRIMLIALNPDSVPSDRVQHYKNFHNTLVKVREKINDEALSEPYHLQSIDEMIRTNEELIQGLTKFELDMTSEKKFSFRLFQSHNEQSSVPLTDKEEQELAQRKAKRRGLQPVEQPLSELPGTKPQSVKTPEPITTETTPISQGSGSSRNETNWVSWFSKLGRSPSPQLTINPPVVDTSHSLNKP